MNEPITIGWRTLQDMLATLRRTRLPFKQMTVDVPFQLTPDFTINIVSNEPMPEVLFTGLTFRRTFINRHEWEPVTKLNVIGREVPTGLRKFLGDYFLDEIENGRIPYEDMPKLLSYNHL